MSISDSLRRRNNAKIRCLRRDTRASRMGRTSRNVTIQSQTVSTRSARRMVSRNNTPTLLRSTRTPLGSGTRLRKFLKNLKLKQHQPTACFPPPPRRRRRRQQQSSPPPLQLSAASSSPRLSGCQKSREEDTTKQDWQGV